MARLHGAFTTAFCLLAVAAGAALAGKGRETGDEIVFDVRIKSGTPSGIVALPCSARLAELPRQEGKGIADVKETMEAAGLIVRDGPVGSGFTDDWNPDRVTLQYDDAGVVVVITCG